jgi:hypothetical protein
MFPSDARQKITTGNPVLGASMFTRKPFLAQSNYQTGADRVWIDQEQLPKLAGETKQGPVAG